MLLNNKASRGRWRARMVLGVVLALLGLAQVGLSPSGADFDHTGGFVQTHRYRDPLAQPPAPLRTAPSPPSTFPDGDAYYPSFSSGREPVLPRSSPASTVSHYFSPTRFPWNHVDFAGYEDPLHLPQDATLIAPKKYALEAAALSSELRTVRLESALLIAHLPEHAVFWVDGTRTQSTGRTRYFQSPQLQPGRKYSYTVCAAWIEDGRWASQTRMIPVRAGIGQAIYLRPLPGSQVKTKPELVTPPTEIARKSPSK